MKKKNLSRPHIKRSLLKIDPVRQIIKAKAILAPMSGITDIPFRLMARKYGCEFAFTEMIDVNGIIYNNRKSFQLMDKVKGDEPLGVQLVGQDADKFLRVAKICEEKGFKLVDINAGCPARKVVTPGKGAALMRDPVKLSKIVKKLVKGLSIQVTVKMRSGWNDKSINFLEVAKAIQGEGADAVGIHVRTKEQMYKGEVRYDFISKLKNKIKIPVIASGNIFTAQDVKTVLENTGCDAVFVARGALGHPWIFDDIKKCLKNEEESYNPDFRDFKRIVKRHFLLSTKYYTFSIVKKKMYKHLTWYFKKHKGLNDIMKEYMEIEDTEEFEEFIKNLHVEEKNRLFL